MNLSDANHSGNGNQTCWCWKSEIKNIGNTQVRQQPRREKQLTCDCNPSFLFLFPQMLPAPLNIFSSIFTFMQVSGSASVKLWLPGYELMHSVSRGFF